MTYWQFKFKGDGTWKNWETFTVGSKITWKSPKTRNKKPNDISVGDILFLYRTDADRGIYFISKIIDVNFDNPTDDGFPIEFEIIKDLNNNIFKPENFGFDSLLNKINELKQNGTYYKFDNSDNIQEMFNLIINDEFEKIRLKHPKQKFEFLEYYRKELENNTTISSQTTSEKRNYKIANAPKIPEKIQIISNGFKRNPDIIVEVLYRANGICEHCKSKAPFIRKTNNTPYLEVHHKKTLANGGEDTIKNAIAVCPNCHKYLHFGK